MYLQHLKIYKYMYILWAGPCKGELKGENWVCCICCLVLALHLTFIQT